MSTELVRTVETTARVTEGMLRACGAVGLSVRRVERRARDPRFRAAAAELDAALRPGQVALLTGPSGSGKTSVLRALMARSRRGGLVAATGRAGGGSAARGVEARSGRAVIDVVGQSWDEAMRTLARAGLADAELLTRREAELSEGQRARLRVAVALARAQSCGAGRVTVVIDEFASTLDRPTARLLCRALRRWLRREGRARLVVASAHADVEAWLKPEWVWRGS